MNYNNSNQQNEKISTNCRYVNYVWNGENKKLFGGSFLMAPKSDDYLIINLMAEYDLDCDFYLPIKDYEVPENIDDMIKIFEEIKKTNKHVFVGCLGGMGRTGLFMSCFLKYLGYQNSFEIVRSQYNPNAVENEKQKKFIDDFFLKNENETLDPQDNIKNNFKGKYNA